ncbi:B-cell antigen receptor complex-associated protein beta chain [Chaetodon trifascialis]|uniref:B-cell antigen receptor complex-associated protein beta chain n=1 Tax=Chaetodon trifascialis TaxID=109706 RepID=UPI00399343FD
MRWLLAGYCGLALISMSVALSDALTVIQTPRAHATKTHTISRIFCLHKEHLKHNVTWYKADEYNSEQREEIKTDDRITAVNHLTPGPLLLIKDLRIEDRGVYFCKIENAWGPGTAIHVTRPFNRSHALYRTQMKDALIILQGLLLAVSIAAILLRKRQVSDNTDSLYEEPETDHIYEGLTIETCGGGLYEELSVYAQADGAEAPWE